MAVEVTMPQMGADMTEGVVLRWLKQVGEEVVRGEAIAEIETDKATVELEAFESGTLLRYCVEEGETVPVGETIALLGAEGEEPPPVERSVPVQEPLRRPTEPAVVAAVQDAEAQAPVQTLPAASVAPPEADSRLRISPVARRIAMDAGLDVRGLSGTGPDGRILRRDVESALRAGAVEAPLQTAQASGAEPAADEGGELVPLTRMRGAIARLMLQAKTEQPHYYLTVEVDMTAALAFREQFNAVAAESERASINDLIVKACAVALARHPKFNAEFGDEGIVLHHRINIAIGVALDDGLVAPALLDCGSKTLGQIAREAKDLVARTRDGRLSANEYGSGTFTVTNLGAYGVEILIGIINPPQSAILGVGTVAPGPAVRDGEVVARQLMKIALSADHRVTDGAEGARFIGEVRALLESPAALAL